MRITLILVSIAGIVGAGWLLLAPDTEVAPNNVQQGGGSPPPAAVTAAGATREQRVLVKQPSGPQGEVQFVRLDGFPGRDELGRSRVVRAVEGADGNRFLALDPRHVPAVVTRQARGRSVNGRKVQVTLVDPAGGPLVGESVTFRVLDVDVWLSRERRVHSGVVGADGVAVIPDLVPEGNWKVSAGHGVLIDESIVRVTDANEAAPLAVKIVGRRRASLSGNVITDSVAATRLEVVCADDRDLGVRGAPRHVADAVHVAPNGAFSFLVKPVRSAAVRLGCRMTGGSTWWNPNSFLWPQSGIELVPPLTSTLRITVFDAKGARLPRYGIVLGADSRTRAGSAASMSHAGFHQNGELLVEACDSGAQVLRVVPLDVGVPASEPVALNLSPGASSVTVHVGESWELLVSVITKDGHVVPKATVDIIAGKARARASDINYSPVLNGLLIPNIGRLDHAVRIGRVITDANGEAAFVLPSQGQPVAVRVSSERSLFLPAFVETVPRQRGRSAIDVVVASGSRVRCKVRGLSGRLQKDVSLALRRDVAIPGAINQYPIEWHQTRPQFQNEECDMLNVPYGRWRVDVYVGGVLRHKALTLWDIDSPSEDPILDLSGIAADTRVVRLKWAQEGVRLGGLDYLTEKGATPLTVSKLPCDATTHVQDAGFIRAVVRTLATRRIEKWYSRKRFAWNEAIEGEVGPHSLKVAIPKEHVGKVLVVKGPTPQDVVQVKLNAAETVTLRGVCPFDVQLLVGERLVCESAVLEPAIREGTVLRL